MLQPLGATHHKAFTDRLKRAVKRHAAAPPTKKVFLAPSYPHTERLLSDYEGYLLASENKPHPHEVSRYVASASLHAHAHAHVRWRRLLYATPTDCRTTQQILVFLHRWKRLGVARRLFRVHERALSTRLVRAVATSIPPLSPSTARHVYSCCVM